MQLGFSFEFSKFVICEIRDKPASEKTLIINALNSICTTNKLSPSSKLDLCKLIGKETWFKPDYLPRFYENIDKFCDLLKLFEKETTHDLFYVAAFIICETRNEQEPLKILIFDAVEFILTTDKLTSDQKKTIFVDFVYKQNSWFKVDRLPEFLKMVCDYRPENGFLNLLDAARDRFTPDKKRENVSQPTELDEQSKLKPDATFLSAPVDMSKNEEVRSEGVLMQLIPQLYLTDPEVRFARMHLCQSTSSSSSQLFSHKGYFCEKLKGYELNKHQKRLISLCASDYKQPGIDVSSLVRGRPWIDSQQQVNVLEKMLKDSIWLKEALEILFKIEELSKVGEREFDKEELNNQLINFETLRNKFYPYQIKQIFLDLDTTSDSSIKLSKGYIEMLCAFIKADCTPDFVLQKAEEITDNPEANKIYEALAFLMRKPEGEEIFRDLVHKSWFDVEHLIQLKDIIDNGAELKNAVNQLEQSVLAELSQAPKV